MSTLWDAALTTGPWSSQGGQQVFVATTATPSPEVSLHEGLKDTDVSPGFVGFAVTFVVVVAVIGLMLSMTKRVRRIAHSQNASHTVEAELQVPTDDRP